MTTATYIRVPLVELVRRELCRHAVGTIITTSVRKLAAAVARPQSVGAMQTVLETLETDGWIARATDATCTVIEVKRGDQAADRSELAATLADPIVLPSPTVAGDQPIDRSVPASAGDQSADRLVCMDDHDLNQNKEEEGAHAPRLDASNRDPRIGELLAIGCYTAEKAQQVLAAQPPEFSVADARRAVTLAEQRGRSPGYAWNTLANGRQLTHHQEARHDRRPATPDQSRRTAKPAPRNHLPANLGMEFLD